MDPVAIPLLASDQTPHVYGGRLCLSLVNSLWWRRSNAPIEQLNEYADVVTTAARAGWLPDQLRAGVEGAAAADPGAAQAELAAAIDLRELLFSAFSAVASGAELSHETRERVRAVAAPGLAALDLVPSSEPAGGGYRLAWTRPDLAVPVQQLAVSAVLLLTSPEVDRVKQCPGSSCGWVFVDGSRNRSRRWCDSRECGNRERVRAHYQRTHS